jgi:hypothetical protein
MSNLELLLLLAGLLAAGVAIYKLFTNYIFWLLVAGALCIVALFTGVYGLIVVGLLACLPIAAYMRWADQGPRIDSYRIGREHARQISAGQFVKCYCTNPGCNPHWPPWTAG